MTASDFNKLDTASQKQLLISDGTLLKHIETGTKLECLYKLHSFFVEATFDKNKGQFKRIEAFEDGKKLDKYLKASQKDQ